MHRMSDEAYATPKAFWAADAGRREANKDERQRKRRQRKIQKARGT